MQTQGSVFLGAPSIPMGSSEKTIRSAAVPNLCPISVADRTASRIGIWETHGKRAGGGPLEAATLVNLGAICAKARRPTSCGVSVSFVQGGALSAATRSSSPRSWLPGRPPKTVLAHA